MPGSRGLPLLGLRWERPIDLCQRRREISVRSLGAYSRASVRGNDKLIERSK